MLWRTWGVNPTVQAHESYARTRTGQLTPAARRCYGERGVSTPRCRLMNHTHAPEPAGLHRPFRRFAHRQHRYGHGMSDRIDGLAEQAIGPKSVAVRAENHKIDVHRLNGAYEFTRRVAVAQNA